LVPPSTVSGGVESTNPLIGEGGRVIEPPPAAPPLDVSPVESSSDTTAGTFGVPSPVTMS
jgi:hypothetical protein